MLSNHHSYEDLRVHALASGSSGNALLIQTGTTHILIDAGLPVRTLSGHLAKRGVRAADLTVAAVTEQLAIALESTKYEVRSTNKTGQ